MQKLLLIKSHHYIASGDTHVEVSPIQRINKNSILIEIRWINSKGLKEKSLVLSRSEFAQVVKDLRPEIQKICQEKYEDAKQGEF